jgi:hypothetical protein
LPEKLKGAGSGVLRKPSQGDASNCVNRENYREVSLTVRK